MGNLKMVCAHCGSDEVSRDAAVRWDIGMQAWQISSIYDNGSCDHCGSETKQFNEEAAEPAEVAKVIGFADIVPPAVALAEGWDLFDVDSKGIFQIQRDDDSAIFQSDIAAVDFVRKKASEGSEVHMRALAAHLVDAAKLTANKGQKSIDNALTHLSELSQFAYENGFHELGYDPVADVRAALDGSLQLNNILQGQLQNVVAGFDIIEGQIVNATKADPSDAPFPMDPEQAVVWHRARQTAYTHALEMCNEQSVRQVIATL